MSPSIKTRIHTLSTELRQHNYLYYVLAEPSISDREFDALLHELETLEREYPELSEPNSPAKNVGGDVTKNFITKPHSLFV